MTAPAQFDVVALARRINLRLQEIRDLYPDRTIRITPVMSRILENDPDYIPYRARAAGKKRRPATNPGVAALVAIAATLETTVGDLLGEPRRLTRMEQALFEDIIAMIDGILARGRYAALRKKR